MTEGKWSDIESDWNNGCFNPFNQYETISLKSKVLSFYKGETVIQYSIENTTSCQIFGTIFLNSNVKNDLYGHQTLNHEWGIEFKRGY